MLRLVCLALTVFSAKPKTSAGRGCGVAALGRGHLASDSGNRQDFVRESSRIGFNLGALVLSRLVSLALSLVQSSIIFRALGLEGTGRFGYALLFTSMFTVFATLGIQRLLVRDIARDRNIAWTYVWTATVVVSGLSVLVLAVIAGSTALLEDSAQVRNAVLAAALWVVVLWALQQPFESLLIACERMGLVAVANVAVAALKLASVYVAVRHTQTAAVAHGAIAFANLAGLLLTLIFAVAVGGWERPHLRFGLAWQQVRECFPFAVAMLFSLVYFKLDMSLLKFLQGEAASGIYTPAQRVMEPLLMVAALWGTAVFPALCRFSHTDPEHYANLKATSIRLALMAAFPMAIGIALLAEPIILLLTGDLAAFGQSVLVLRILAGVVPLFYLNSIGQEFFYSLHRNWYVVACYAAAGAVSVVGNLVFIPCFSVPGLAGVAVAANLAVTALFVLGMRSQFGEVRITHLLPRTLLACVAMGAVALAMSRISLIAGVVAGALVYALLQWVLGALNALERDMIGHMLQAVLRRVPLG